MLLMINIPREMYHFPTELLSRWSCPIGFAPETGSVNKKSFSRVQMLSSDEAEAFETESRLSPRCTYGLNPVGPLCIRVRKELKAEAEGGL